MWLCALGLGFSTSWLWTVFLNGPLLAAVAARHSEDLELILLTFLLFHSLSFLFTAVWLSRSAALASNFTLLISAVLCMTIGTLIVGFVPSEPLFNYRWPLVLIASAIAGLGSAPIVAAWGEVFGKRQLKEVGLGYALAISVSTGLFFFINTLTTQLGFILAASFPLISLGLFLKAQQPQTATVFVKASWHCPLPPKLLALLALFYLNTGFMHKLIYAVDNLPLQETYWLTNIIYCLVCLVAGISTFLRPNMDLRRLYRPALPLLGAGFILFPFLSSFYELLPFALLQSGFALFDVYTWLLFVYLGSLQGGSGYLVSWGMFFLTLATFCGEILSNLLVEAALSLRQLDSLSIFAALLMFVTTLIFQDERETFAGWSATQAKPKPLLLAVDEAVASTPPLVVKPENAISSLVPAEQQFCSLGTLTARECEIALLLLKRRNNPYIREALNISDNTLKSHLRNIYRKLDVNNRQELFDQFDQFCKDPALVKRNNF